MELIYFSNFKELDNSIFIELYYSYFKELGYLDELNLNKDDLQKYLQESVLVDDNLIYKNVSIVKHNNKSIGIIYAEIINYNVENFLLDIDNYKGEITNNWGFIR